MRGITKGRLILSRHSRCLSFVSEWRKEEEEERTGKVDGMAKPVTLNGRGPESSRDPARWRKDWADRSDSPAMRWASWKEMGDLAKDSPSKMEGEISASVTLAGCMAMGTGRAEEAEREGGGPRVEKLMGGDLDRLTGSTNSLTPSRANRRFTESSRSSCIFSFCPMALRRLRHSSS